RLRPRELSARVRSLRSNSRPEDIDDAMQDVLLRIHTKLQSDSPPAAPNHPDAFVLKSVLNQLNSMYRSRKREVLGAPDHVVDGHAQLLGEDQKLSPEHVAEARERAALFQQLVRQIQNEGEIDDTDTCFATLQARLHAELSSREWILLRLRVLRGMGLKECAQRLNISTTSAHNWTRKAERITRECLREFGIDAGDMNYDDRPDPADNNADDQGRDHHDDR
ncbi:MAG: hypothetical protein AAFU65_10015, partial [Pseudomonadota bacterium]